ncbi:GntR family transcriptional regulator [Mycolicibacterium sp. Dal123E01]|uniref:GntR family transcriptional regulator n=1 Tax=Mycolicibacterium sp. Dal123E01 TaxID=3457578 RepID=UPI00403EEBEA
MRYVWATKNEGMAVVELRTMSIPDAVYEAVRERIVVGEFGPGTALTESSVAGTFNVARPTAKAAIERLVADGLLRREMHRVARVPELNRSDIEDLYATRALIESAAVSNLAQSGTVPAESLAAHRLVLARTSEGETSFPQLDMQFHRSLVVAQRSSRLTRMHSMIMSEVEMCIGQAQAQKLMPTSEIVEQHQQIIDAVAAGDPVIAEHVTRKHIEKSRDYILAGYDGRQSANSSSSTGR